MTQPAGDSSVQARELVDELLARGAALASQTVDRRILALARLARSWLDPSDPFRKEALAILPAQCSLAPEQVAWGLDQAFGVIDEGVLLRWWEREGAVSAAQLSGHIWAGNVFVAGLPPVVASLLAGVPALVKSPAALPGFARLLAQSVEAAGPELAGAVGALAWDREDLESTSVLLAGCQPVFAFGQDSSIGALRTQLPEGRDLCGFGHRYSIAVVSAQAPVVAPLLPALALDHLVWDGLGCLSPRWIFVEGKAELAASLAREAAELLPSLAEAIPGQPLGAAAGAKRAAWLGECAFSGWSVGGSGWAVAAIPEPDVLESAPPPRSLCFVPLEDLDRLGDLLSPLGQRLQGLSLVGPAPVGRRLQALLAPLGLSRLAPAGQLQRPPVDWNHDGIRVLAELCRT